jgi:hypothetical protein
MKINELNMEILMFKEDIKQLKINLNDNDNIIKNKNIEIE